MFFTDEVSHTPAGSVEVLARGAHRDCEFGDFWGQSGDASKRDVEEAVVDFVGENDDVVFYAEGGDLFEFFAGHDFTNGVVSAKKKVRAGCIFSTNFSTYGELRTCEKSY